MIYDVYGLWIKWNEYSNEVPLFDSKIFLVGGGKTFMTVQDETLMKARKQRAGRVGSPHFVTKRNKK